MFHLISSVLKVLYLCDFILQPAAVYPSTAGHKDNVCPPCSLKHLLSPVLPSKGEHRLKWVVCFFFLIFVLAKSICPVMEGHKISYVHISMTQTRTNHNCLNSLWPPHWKCMLITKLFLSVCAPVCTQTRQNNMWQWKALGLCRAASGE